jgi:spore coat protein A
MNRRQFLQTTAGAAALLATGRNAFPFAQSPQVTKWAQLMRGVTDIPISAPGLDPIYGAAVDFHQIDIIELSDQLHQSLGPTKLWGFNPVNPLVPAVTNRHLGGLIVAERGRAVRLRATNKLTATAGLVPVDQTIPGANMGPTRTAIHLHGGLVPWISDGGPFDWFGPSVGPSFQNGAIPGAPNGTPTADYFYPNNQSARLLWYHDHAFGITRTNAYSGIAAGYLITDTLGGAGCDHEGEVRRNSKESQEFRKNRPFPLSHLQR